MRACWVLSRKGVGGWVEGRALGSEWGRGVGAGVREVMEGTDTVGMQ